MEFRQKSVSIFNLQKQISTQIMCLLGLNVAYRLTGFKRFQQKLAEAVKTIDNAAGRASWAASRQGNEPDVPGDPFDVSDADTMLAYLDPEAANPHDVAVFSRPGCAFCATAKTLLNDAGIEFEELVLNQDYTDQTLRAISSATSYPQVFIDGVHIGGADELQAWLTSDHQQAA